MDLIVDTNSLTDMVKKKDKVIERCDVIYLPRCVWKNEAPVHLKHLWMFVIDVLRELESKRKFYVKLPKKSLPEELKKALVKAGADECDMNIVRLALERKEKIGKAIIITKNKEHFQRVPGVIRYVGRENMILPEEYN